MKKDHERINPSPSHYTLEQSSEDIQENKHISCQQVSSMVKTKEELLISRQHTALSRRAHRLRPSPSIRSTEQTEDTEDPSSTSVEEKQGPTEDILHQKGLTNSEKQPK